LSAGISAGIDMSLYVVSRLLGESRAIEAARRMEYEWTLSAAEKRLMDDGNTNRSVHNG
jgi:transcriptional regulator GlxA family with amidase domain